MGRVKETDAIGIVVREQGFGGAARSGWPRPFRAGLIKPTRWCDRRGGGPKGSPPHGSCQRARAVRRTCGARRLRAGRAPRRRSDIAHRHCPSAPEKARDWRPALPRRKANSSSVRRRFSFRRGKAPAKPRRGASRPPSVSRSWHTSAARRQIRAWPSRNGLPVSDCRSRNFRHEPVSHVTPPRRQIARVTSTINERKRRCRFKASVTL